MADTGDKTEKASPQKLRKARKAGQLPRSRDMSAAIGSLIAIKLLIFLMPSWLLDFRALFTLAFADLAGDGVLRNTWSIAFPASLGIVFKLVAPLAAVPACIILGALFPGGFVFSTENLMPKLSRLSVAKNVGKFFKAQHYITLGTSILKATAIILLIWIITRAHLTDFMHLQRTSLPEAILAGTSLIVDAAMAYTLILIAFALVDVPIQKMVFMRGQRMSKKDVKDEHKNSEGRPEVKGRIRQLQRQAAQRGLAKTVPGADVVVVNPTHYAVALKYDAARAQAPFVVAKGIDDMALVIRRIAQENGIEILPLPPLARAIYHTSQVNQQIPAGLYRAVAQVLTYIVQLRAFRHGRRGLRPDLPHDIDVPESLANANKL